MNFCKTCKWWSPTIRNERMGTCRFNPQVVAKVDGDFCARHTHAVGTWSQMPVQPTEKK